MPAKKPIIEEIKKRHENAAKIEDLFKIPDATHSMLMEAGVEKRALTMHRPLLSALAKLEEGANPKELLKKYPTETVNSALHYMKIRREAAKNK